VDPSQERKERAGSLKAKGNAAYSQKKFEVAADFYSLAINMSPKEDAVFYSNRAACEHTSPFTPTLSTLYCGW